MNTTNYDGEVEMCRINFEEEPEKPVEEEATVVAAPPPKKFYTLPKTPPLNQPYVKPGGAWLMAESKSTSSYHKYGGEGNLSQVSSRSYPEDASYMSEEARVLSEMFTTTFRKLANRNKFTQQVFFVLGVQMCFSFIFFFLLANQKRIYEYFKSKMLMFAIVFTLLVKSMVFCTCMNPKWLRDSPNHFIILVLSTVAVTLQFGTIGAYFDFINILMHITGSLMVAFFVASLIAAQRKFEASGTKMLILFVILSLLISGGITALLAIVLVKDTRAEQIAVPIVIVLIDSFIVMFIIKHAIRVKDLKVTDFIYTTLIVYLSITTLYVLHSVLLLSRKRKSNVPEPEPQ